MMYLILVNCQSPTEAKILSHANGVNQTFSSMDEAEDAVKEINEKSGINAIAARVVCV